jgi:hypothetical protein
MSEIFDWESLRSRGRKRRKREKPITYEVELSEVEYGLLLRSLTRNYSLDEDQKKWLVRALYRAREIPLSRDYLPWDEIAVAAKDQGVSEADVLWDRMNRREQP